MKYYAVTEDPRELMHFGIKGMKWGVIRTDAQLGHIQPPKMPRGMKMPKPRPVKSRSDAYKRASAKLSAGMRRGIKKAQASIREYQSPAAKAERSFQKHLQQARQGKLKYKGISDDEVYRITDRLNMERASRSLSGAEKPSFISRLGSSIGEGVIEGAGRGTSAALSERISRGSRLKTQRMTLEQSNQFARQQKLWEQEQNRRQSLWDQQKNREQTLWTNEQERIKEQRNYDRDRSRQKEKLKDAYDETRAKKLGEYDADLYKQAKITEHAYETEANKYQRDQERKRLERQQHMDDVLNERVAPANEWESQQYQDHKNKQNRLAVEQARQARLARAEEVKRLRDAQAEQDRQRQEQEMQRQEQQERERLERNAVDKRREAQRQREESEYWEAYRQHRDGGNYNPSQSSNESEARRIRQQQQERQKQEQEFQETMRRLQEKRQRMDEQRRKEEERAARAARAREEQQWRDRTTAMRDIRRGNGRW